MPLPAPEAGLVISYSYLWHDESLRGNEEGRKNRPCAIVLVAHDADKTRVLVVPITHNEPKDASIAVEIPLKTKKRLGLDEERSWAICSEVNEFNWPGPDLKPISRKNPDRIDYGFLPPELFKKITTKIQFLAKGRQLKVAHRTE